MLYVVCVFRGEFLQWTQFSHFICFVANTFKVRHCDRSACPACHACHACHERSVVERSMVERSVGKAISSRGWGLLRRYAPRNDSLACMEIASPPVAARNDILVKE